MAICFLNEASTLIYLQQGRTGLPYYSQKHSIRAYLRCTVSTIFRFTQLHAYYFHRNFRLNGIAPFFVGERFIQRAHPGNVSWGSLAVQEECSTPPLLFSCSMGAHNNWATATKPCWHSIESWLVYDGILILAYEINNPPYNWIVFHPLYQTTNQGELNTAQFRRRDWEVIQISKAGVWHQRIYKWWIFFWGILRGHLAPLTDYFGCRPQHNDQKKITHPSSFRLETPRDFRRYATKVSLRIWGTKNQTAGEARRILGLRIISQDGLKISYTLGL